MGAGWRRARGETGGRLGAVGRFWIAVGEVTTLDVRREAAVRLRFARRRPQALQSVAGPSGPPRRTGVCGVEHSAQSQVEGGGCGGGGWGAGEVRASGGC